MREFLKSALSTVTAIAVLFFGGVAVTYFAERIEDRRLEAYEEAYEEGYRRGYDQGYEDALEYYNIR